MSLLKSTDDASTDDASTDRRYLGTPRESTLRDSAQNTMAKIFALTLAHKTHLVPPNSSKSKAEWTALYKCAFDGNASGPGPLMCYKYWDSTDPHLKLKDIIERNARIFLSQSNQEDRK